jgi:hypothetical protein
MTGFRQGYSQQEHGVALQTHPRHQERGENKQTESSWVAITTKIFALTTKLTILIISSMQEDIKQLNQWL